MMPEYRHMLPRRGFHHNRPEENARRKEELLGNLKMMEAYEKELRGVLDQSPDHLYLLLTVPMGKAVYRSHMEWADKAIGMLKASQEG